MTARLAYLVYVLTVAVAVAFVVRRRRTGGPSRMSGVEIAIASVAAVALVFLTSGPPLVDFVKAYHHAGRAALSNPSTLYECARAQCFVNIPLVAVLFVPFAPFDPIVGGVVFSVAGLLALAVGMRRLAAGPSSDVVIWLVVLSGPLYYSIRLGNVTHFLLILFLVAFDGLSRGHQRVPGMLLAGAALLKPPLAIFLPYLLIRHRTAAAGAMGAWAATALLLSVALFGVGLHRYWFEEFVVLHGSEALGAYNVQSAGGFLAHLITRGRLHDWYPLDIGPGFTLLRSGIVGVILTAVVGVCWHAGYPRKVQAWYAELSLVLATAILIAPISWTHYYVLLIVPVAALVSGRLSLPAWGRPVLALSVVLMSLPVVTFGFQGRIANAVYERLLVSHFFFGGLLLLGLLMAARLRADGPAASLPDRARPAGVQKA